MALHVVYVCVTCVVSIQFGDVLYVLYMYSVSICCSVLCLYLVLVLNVITAACMLYVIE